MEMYSRDPQAGIIRLGVFARACLTPGQHGRVLAVFSKAVYLQPHTGELFWITTGDMPMHQRSAAFANSLPVVPAGSAFHVERDRLVLGSRFALDMAGASVWRAPGPGRIVEMNSLWALVHSFYSNLDISQARGFGAFIPQLLYPSQHEFIEPLQEFAEPVLGFAQPLVLNIARGCLEHEPARVLEAADALIGLGPGLTPSGDDFLGGLFFAVKILQAAYPDLDFMRGTVPIERYASRTHLISLTLLKDLSGGHAVAPLHHIVNGLLSGQSPGSISPFLAQLTQIGHSTGWDLLTGLLAGLLTVYQRSARVAAFQPDDLEPLSTERK